MSSSISFYKNKVFIVHDFHLSSYSYHKIVYSSCGYLEGAVSLIYFSDLLLVAYRWDTDFLWASFVFIYYAEWFFSALGVSWWFFWSPNYAIILSVNEDTVTSSLLICIPLITFSYLIALAKTLHTILNRYLVSEKNLVLFLSLVEFLWVAFHLNICWLWAFYKLPLLCWGISLVTVII